MRWSSRAGRPAGTAAPSPTRTARGEVGLLALLQLVAAAVDLPLVAAGGIAPAVASRPPVGGSRRARGLKDVVDLPILSHMLVVALDWNDAQDMVRLRLAGTVARLLDACETEDADEARRLARELTHAATELRAFLPVR